MQRRQGRSGYTLLEVILALGLSVILIAAIQSAAQMTFMQWEVGRQAADEAQVVRALFQRIRSDLQATMTTWAPPKTPQTSSESSSAGATTSGATTSGATTSGATTSGATTPSTGTSSSTGSSSTSSTSSPSSSSSSSSADQNATQFPPGGIAGESDVISAIVRLAPADLDFTPNTVASTTATVLRTVTYRIGTVQESNSIDHGVEGLIRDESPRMPDSTSPDGQTTETRSDLLAPEVKKIRITYYDGLFWDDTWDLMQSGPPICVQVEVGLKVSSFKNVDSDGLRWYSAIIALPPVATSSESSSSSSSSSSGSTPSSATGSTGSSGAATGGTGS